MAETRDVVNFIREYENDKHRVCIWEPTGGERRKVVSVDVEKFAKEYPVTELNIKTPSDLDFTYKTGNG